MYKKNNDSLDLLFRVRRHIKKMEALEDDGDALHNEVVEWFGVNTDKVTGWGDLLEKLYDSFGITEQEVVDYEFKKGFKKK